MARYYCELCANYNEYSTESCEVCGTENITKIEEQDDN